MPQSNLIYKNLDKLSKKVGQTIQTHNLIEPNDKVMVALSGGKDSYVLLEILADRKKHIPFSWDLMAVHVHITDVGYLNDIDYMREFCNQLNVPFTLIEESVPLDKDPKKAPCYVCSWHRRKFIFNLTRELNCNKLAMGHHMDDALETFLMNLTFHGSISSLPVKLSMFEGRMQLIRPLLFTDEAIIKEYAEMRGLVKEKQKCPFDTNTQRNEAGIILDQIAKLNKHARKNMFRAMNNIYPEYLPKPFVINCKE
jgi:tRNA 2-thiocytidine biosynthesis protein TtcA